MAKEQIKEYDVLRVIVTFLVVFGHCNYYQIETAYGGVDVSKLINSDSIVFIIQGKITSLISLFHMPLFMALSGALFFYTMQKKIVLKDLLINKWKRLMIPFVIVTAFYSFPLKFLSGYYSNTTNIFTDMIYGQLFLQGNSHLWYLPTLFLIFIIMYAIEKYFCIKSIIKFTILVLLSLSSSLIEIHLIKYVTQYLLWFYIGYCFEQKRVKINSYITKNMILSIVGITGVSLFIIFWMVTYQLLYAR